jgi:hypothetical protein
MTSAALALLLALAAPPEMNRSSPPARGPAPVASSAPSPALSDAELKERVETYLGSIDTPITADLWRGLGARAVPVLESVVRDPESLPSRRARAVEALSMIGGSRAKQLVLDVARAEDQPFGVRAVALRGAPRLLSPKEISSELEPVLQGAREAPVRATAAEVLARHGAAGSCTAVRAQVAREAGRARGQFAHAVERCSAQQP